MQWHDLMLKGLFDFTKPRL